MSDDRSRDLGVPRARPCPLPRLASTNKCMAQINKSCTRGKATIRRRYRRRGAISCAGQLANGKTRAGRRCRLLHDGIIMRSYRPSSSRRWAVRGLTFRVSCSICRGTLRRRSRRDPPLIHAAVVPQLPGSLGRIDAGIPPPGGFITYAVHQSVMDSTQRHRELIARFATQGPRLQVA